MSSPSSACSPAVRLIVVSVTLVLSGCLTLGGDRRPDWITTIPSFPGYYVGIGSAGSGDRSEDFELAKARALADLAGSISTQITSDQRYVARQTTEGDSFAFAEVVISQSVNEHIREVETVASYYDEEAGSWVLLRLNRDTWHEIQREETARLSERVTGLFDESVNREEPTLSGRLTALSKGHKLLAESPFAGFVEGSLFGRSGIMIDLLESEIVRTVSEMSLRFEPPKLVAEYGRPVWYSCGVRSGSEALAGRFDLLLYPAGRPDRAHVVTTDRTGAYEGVLPGGLLPERPGDVTVTAGVDLGRFDFDAGELPGGLAAPTAELSIEIVRRRAGLSVRVDRAISIAGVEAAFRELLSSFVPIELVSTGPEESTTVIVELSAREAPKSELTQGLTFVFLQAAVSILTDGETVAGYRSDERKGGGLNASQAQDAAFDELLEHLAVDRDLRAVLENTLGGSEP